MPCQLSYPLNSENASPPGTCTVYFACPASCATTDRPPTTPSMTSQIPMTTPTASPLPVISRSPLTRLQMPSRRETSHRPEAGGLVLPFERTRARHAHSFSTLFLSP